MTGTLKPIRYRTFGGGGPKVVLLHGGMQTAQNFRKLAVELADQFTVYVPDRRGRGASGDYAPDHGLSTEIRGLEPVIPCVRRVTLPGVGHLAADNSGKPQLVAEHLRAFFG